MPCCTAPVRSASRCSVRACSAPAPTTTSLRASSLNLERRFRETSSEWVKEEIALVMSSEVCPACHGRRLKPTSLAVTVGGINISDFCEKSVNEELAFISTAKVSARDEMIAAPIFKEVKERLGFLKSVGLGYLTLSRGAASLSGGESQRIRLATQIGSAPDRCAVCAG